MKYPDLLIGIRPDATVYGVLNEYQQIRAFIGAPIDFMHRGDGSNAIGMYINDEGLLDPSLDLNWVGSMLVQYPVYGSVIVCDAEADGDGDTQPPNRRLRQYAEGLAEVVYALFQNAATVGQVLMVRPNPDTVPAPKILTGKDFDEALDRLFRGDTDDPDPDR
jgi:hypothetical protein